LRNDDAPTAAAARRCIDLCLGHVRSRGESATLALLEQEVQAYRFFDVQAALLPTHNEWVATPGARNGDREAALVAALCRELEVPDDILTREAPSAAAGGKWGNFYEALCRKLLALVPPPFLRVYDEHPPVGDFALLTQFSSEAIAAAEARAERLACQHFGGVRTAAYDQETLRQESLVPYRHRGRVPRCMREFQNLFVLPLRRCISHAVPTNATLKVLAKLGPVVEMGAGSGYWAAMLRERGVDVLAYDVEPPDEASLNNGFAYRPFTEVRQGDASLFATDDSLARRTLLLVWPGQADVGPRDEAESGWEAHCLRSYLEAGGQTVVYVGEREEAVQAKPGTAPDCGVSASRTFQVLLRTRFNLVEQLDVPRLFYTCDDLTVWKRLRLR